MCICGLNFFPRPVTLRQASASFLVIGSNTEEVEAADHDAELLRRCSRSDEGALTELVARYQQRLFGLAYRVCGDSALAEEAVVEAFYKIWRKAGQWRGDTSPEAWIYRIAARTVMDLRRGRARWWRRAELAKETDLPKSVPDPAVNMIGDEDHRANTERLEQAIRTLKEDDRMLVHLFYFEERGLKEIETILEVPHAALKMRLARARKKLRRVLEEKENDDAK